jgi:predicted phage terminase large subunit-like protein
VDLQQFLLSAARNFEPTQARKWASPAGMGATLDARFLRTPAIDLIDVELRRALTTPDARLILSCPPQEGKSTLATKWAPVWLLNDQPDTRVVVASYSAAVARRMGRLIRSEITTHTDDLAIRLKDDVAAQNEFEISGHQGGVYAVGIGGSLTSRPADVLIIDDPLKDREQADSETFRERAWEWWTSTASSRLAPGAPVILILTRWHHADLAGKLLAAEDGHLWRVVNIPAQADYDTDAGETDPLGRAPGEYMISARGRTPAQWEARKIQAGPRDWNALYQGRPTADTGNLFPKTWARYEQPLWIARDDGTRWLPGGGHEVAISADLTFKDKPTADYVVLQVWARLGVNVYLLDQVRARLNFTATVDALKALSAKWPQATAKFVEDKANGPAVINALQSTVMGLIPVEPLGSKYARASAISPLTHAGNVVLPDPGIAPWITEFVEECRAFPAGAHDDQVDAMSQAVNQLLLNPLFEDDTFDSDDLVYDDPHAYLGGY